MAMIELCADLTHLGAIRAFVRRTLCELGLDASDVHDFTLAVDEICSNAIKHGYRGQAGRLELTVRPVEGGVQATVRDWGQAFDPQSVPVPDRSAPLEARPLGGLGLYLAGQLVDELEYTADGENGNTATLVMQW